MNYIYLGRYVGDEELSQILALDGLDGLQRVVLNDSRVTEKGLALLRDHRHLRWVHIRDTPSAEPGVAALRRALPDCDVEYVMTYVP